MLINIADKKAPVYVDPVTVTVIIDKSSVRGDKPEVCVAVDSGLSWIESNLKAASVAKIVNKHKPDNKVGFDKP